MSLRSRFQSTIALASLITLGACGSRGHDPVSETAAGGGGGLPSVTTPIGGPHAVANHLEDAAGNRLMLRGVNRSGSEYKCIQNGGFFDGDSDEASVQAIASWKVNAVRIPLNESCWLAISGAPAAYAGDNYKNAIKDYVALLHAYSLIPILDLHWSSPGDIAATRLQPMPSADHAPAFWSDVATTFLGDENVVFEAYNEPFPDTNSDSDAAWQCWRDGCTAILAPGRGATQTNPPTTYPAAGLQSLVSAIRDVGARNLILLGGVQYSNGLSQWLTFKPTDPLQNLAAAWHVYNSNPCRTVACWNDLPATLAAVVPIVATEIGQNDCESTFIAPLLQFLDERGSGYLPWSWNAFGPCTPTVVATATTPAQRGRPWSLVTDYASGSPNSRYAQAYYDHLLEIATAP